MKNHTWNESKSDNYKRNMDFKMSDERGEKSQKYEKVIVSCPKNFLNIEFINSNNWK